MLRKYTNLENILRRIDTNIFNQILGVSEITSTQQDIIDNCIEEATQQIQSYTVLKYGVWEDVYDQSESEHCENEIPGLIVQICSDLTIFLIYNRYRIENEYQQKAYKILLQKLKSIRDGKISLEMDSQSVTPVTSTLSWTSEQRYF